MKSKPLEIGQRQSLNPDHAEVIGSLPESRPYVWISRGTSYLTSIDTRQMDALVRRWLKAKRRKP